MDPGARLRVFRRQASGRRDPLNELRRAGSWHAALCVAQAADGLTIKKGTTPKRHPPSLSQRANPISTTFVLYAKLS
jgi:hypothetical protein